MSSPEAWTPPTIPGHTLRLTSATDGDGPWTPPDLSAAWAPGSPAAAAVDTTGRSYDDGRRDGERAARQELEPGLNALGTMVDAIGAAERDAARLRERRVIALALAVARHLLQREVATDPDVIRGLVVRALDLFTPASAVDVRLHPADLESLGPDLDRVCPPGRDVAVQWVADATLARGDCIATSGLRVVDGRADVALRSIFDAIEHGHGT